MDQLFISGVVGCFMFTWAGNWGLYLLWLPSSRGEILPIRQAKLQTWRLIQWRERPLICCKSPVEIKSLKEFPMEIICLWSEVGKSDWVTGPRVLKVIIVLPPSLQSQLGFDSLPRIGNNLVPQSASLCAPRSTVFSHQLIQKCKGSGTPGYRWRSKLLWWLRICTTREIVLKQFRVVKKRGVVEGKGEPENILIRIKIHSTFTDHGSIAQWNIVLAYKGIWWLWQVLKVC